MAKALLPSLLISMAAVTAEAAEPKANWAFPPGLGSFHAPRSCSASKLWWIVSMRRWPRQVALDVLKRGGCPPSRAFILWPLPYPHPGPFSVTHLVVDETGHPPEADDRVCGLVGTVQGHSGLACQGSEGGPDAEDTLLAVNVKLEVSQAVRLVLDPQGLLWVLPELDPAEVDAVMLQRHIRT